MNPSFLSGTRKGPVLLFLLLLTLFLASFLFLQQDPVLESMSPRIGKAGQQLVLSGRYFGLPEDGGWITLAGERILPAGIVAWTPGEIIFTVPPNPGSGPVVVHTGNGRSRRLLFTSEADIPVLLDNRDPRQAAWIATASAPVWQPGLPCTIRGGSFGPDPGSGWLAVGTAQVRGPDILDWSGDSITFVLPQVEPGSKVAVASGRGSGTGLGLPDIAQAWRVTGEARYQVTMSAGIGEVELEGASPSGLIAAYLPRPDSLRGQVLESVQSRGAETAPDAWVVLVANPAPDTSYDTSVSFQVRRSTAVPVTDDPGLAFPDPAVHSRLLGPSRLVPAASQPVKNFVRTALQPGMTPLAAAQQLFMAVLGALEPDPEAGFAYGADALGDGLASSFGYAGLLVVALRQAGIPAVLVEGLVLEGEEPRNQFWVQALVPGLGWFELDPYEAEFDLRRQPDLPPRELLFASAGLDHIYLSRGESAGSLTRMDPEIRRSFQRNVLLGIQGESSGNIGSYGLFMPAIQIRRLE